MRESDSDANGPRKPNTTRQAVKPDGAKPPTIRDVARTCGVSPMTVSFVLNDRAGQVSSETRAKVLKAIRDLDYRPAAPIRSGEPHDILTLGLVAGVEGHPLLQSGYYASIANGILRATDAQGHNLTLFNHSLMHSDTRRSIRVFCDGRCDGLLIIAPLVGSPLVAALRERGLPFVLVGDPGDGDNISFVDVNNKIAGEQAVKFLTAQGHRRIAHVKGPDFVRSATDRAESFRRALAACGLPDDPFLQWTGTRNFDESARLTRAIMSSPPATRPTALFCWNDGTATSTLQTLRAMNLRVPEDVSVIGFDDDVIAADADPPLTTFRQPFSKIGRRAAELLVSLVSDPASGPHQEMFDAELVVRASVGPPPADKI